MAHEPDAGLVKRGLFLLILMLLLVGSVLFIVFQGPAKRDTMPLPRAENVAWSVVVPTTPFPGNVSWGALAELSKHIPSPPGWEIRYNAAATLARRGSDHVPWQLFREMLDPQRTAVNLRDQLRDSQESPESSARVLVIAALKAVGEWHTRRREANRTDVPAELAEVHAAVDRLAGSPAPEIREQAQKTQAAIQGKS
jgi:hypothetical protein